MSINMVKFEADEQRQHARYKLPLKCVIDQHRYEAVDFSVAGIGIATGTAVLRKGKIVPVQLQFPFDGFEFSLNLKAEICYSDPVSGRSGFKYVELTDSNVRILRYILDSYLSGELLMINELLDFSRRSVDLRARSKNRDKPVRSVSQRAGHALRRSLSLTATTVLSLGVLLVLFGGLYQKLWVFEATSAIVAIDSVPVVAPSDGVLTNLVTGPVKSGERIATILTGTGQSVSVVSSCDCIADRADIDVDAQVKNGQQLLSLLPSGATPHITALVDRAHVMDLYEGVDVAISLPQGKVINNATILELPKISETQLAGSNPVPVKIALEGVGAGTVGAPADVRFDKGPRSFLQGWFTTLAAQLP